MLLSPHEVTAHFGTEVCEPKEMLGHRVTCQAQQRMKERHRITAPNVKNRTLATLRQSGANGEKRVCPKPLRGGHCDPTTPEMLEELQRRNDSANTVRSYIHSNQDFAKYFGRSPLRLGPEHIRQYQVHLFRDSKLSAGTIEGSSRPVDS